MYKALITQLTTWAQAREDMVGVALVGSWARDEAREDSDVDLVIIADNPEDYVNDITWTADFGEVRSHMIEDWGSLTSVRVYYESGLEVEFGFTNRVWASIHPVDQGTQRVVTDGLKILLDKEGLFAMLKNAIDGIIIRPGTMDDYDELSRLMAQTDKFHRDQYPQYFREATPSHEWVFIEPFIVDEEREIFVAEQNSKLRGAILIEVRFVPEVPIVPQRSYVMIDRLLLDEASCSSGIGQALVRAAHEWGQARGIREFQLGVYTFNEQTINLFRTLGYNILQYHMVRYMPEQDQLEWLV